MNSSLFPVAKSETGQTIIPPTKYSNSRSVSKRKIIAELKNSGTQSTSEIYRPSDRRLSVKLVPTLADRGCRGVRATNPHGC
jgi:hypothetical protein